MRKWKEPEAKRANRRALRKFVNYPKGKENDRTNGNMQSQKLPDEKDTKASLIQKKESRSFTEQKDVIICEIRGDDRPIAMRLDSSRQNSHKATEVDLKEMDSATIIVNNTTQSLHKASGNDAESFNIQDSEATQKQQTLQESSINSLEVVLDARTSQ